MTEFLKRAMTSSRQLRKATDRVHRELEETAFAKDLIGGRTSQEVYVDYLRAVAVIIANLRTAIRRDGSGPLRQLLPVLRDWNQRITRDISELAPDDGLANPYAQAAVLRYIQRLFRKIVDDPGWVYGLLYVIYGSHGGNRAVANAVTRTLDLEDSIGTTYLRALEHDKTTWPLFKAMLDRDLRTPELLNSAKQGANDAFALFHEVFDALGGDYQREVKASAINPEAGDHPMPKDKRLAALGNEIGRRVYSEFGYLEQRYGDRGESFTRSDGAWMITLGDVSMERACKLIDWLTRLLSARGIPSFCMEYHLRTLHEALEQADSLPSQDPDRLLKLASRVGILRQSFISDDEWHGVLSTPLPVLDPHGSATLLSAVIDQRLGLAKCADSMVSWLEKNAAIDEDAKLQLLAFLEGVNAQSHHGMTSG